MQKKIKHIQSNEQHEYEASEVILYDEQFLNYTQSNENINFLNINVIASEPNSNIIDNYRSNAEEQLKDTDIQWIEALILAYGDEKPKRKEFNNKIQKDFYREYHRLRIVDNILYRTSEEKNGYMRTQFVLPGQITKEVIEQIHTSVYNAHLVKLWKK